MLFKLSNLALTLGYLNLALNNSALVFCKWYYSNPFRFSETIFKAALEALEGFESRGPWGEGFDL